MLPFNIDGGPCPICGGHGGTCSACGCDDVTHHQYNDLIVIEEIAAERKRQIEIEGWTSEHDDCHPGEMAKAAATYAMQAVNRAPHRPGSCPLSWPWDVAAWNPKGPRRDLIRAGALIVAEIERMDRDAAKTALLEWLKDGRHAT